MASEVHMRRKALQLWKKLNFRFVRFYTWMKSSELKSCGENVRFDYPVRLENPGSISIGSGVILYPRVWLNAVSEWRGNHYSGTIELGDRAMIGYGVQISAAQSIIIEDDVAMGAGTVIVDHIHDHRYPGIPIIDSPLSTPEPVRIGKHSFLGVYCLIGPGVQIGEHAVIAANAVVLKDVPAYCIAAGNPARIVRFHDPNAPKPDEELTEASIA
jgi:acetyltransferase-like isoleucine patch superfamily enzyme